MCDAGRCDGLRGEAWSRDAFGRCYPATVAVGDGGMVEDWQETRVFGSEFAPGFAGATADDFRISVLLDQRGDLRKRIANRSEWWFRAAHKASYVVSSQEMTPSKRPVP